MPEPDHTPTGDLRERLANTLHCPTCGVEPGEHCLRAREDNLHPHMTRVQAADAVMHVVEHDILAAEAAPPPPYASFAGSTGRAGSPVTRAAEVELLAGLTPEPTSDEGTAA